MSSVPHQDYAAAADEDDGIPVLTEVVSASVLANTQRLAALDGAAAAAHLEKTQNLQVISAPLAVPSPACAATQAHFDAPVSPVSAGYATASGVVPPSNAAHSDTEMDALSLRVQSRVLAGLMTRIDPVVDQRLRESLTDLLEQVLAGMTAELKVTARRIVRDAVAQAVAAELAALYKPSPPLD